MLGGDVAALIHLIKEHFPDKNTQDDSYIPQAPDEDTREWGP